MARGSEAKSARKQARKEARAKEAERILNGEDALNDFDSPPVVDDHDSDDSAAEEDDNDANSPPEKTPEKTKSKSNRAKKAMKDRSSSAANKQPSKPSDSGGIKTLPLVFLIMLTGTTVLPALLYLGDYLSAYAAKNHFMGNIGHRLGIGPNPKKRVISFYEKHDPEKINEVPSILAKYYGDYPKLIKRLERKYGDYGYFLNWEQDEAPMYLALDKLYETRDLLQSQFNKHAPAVVKTGVRNMQHNLGFVYKKVHKTWKKQVWPILQPYLGVPDEKEARRQKLKDKREAEKRKKATSGRGRRKSAEFRDEEDGNGEEQGNDEM
ncbi:hypothetical protein ACHAWO_004850 [Cyclotella atomus]|jgi:hypothetical protein|uniref:Uncharacterized protein n=1 Tax=Cyclotella atomus TaxID=382360 RepID=A0ABD3NT17_9STRA